jgi:hypothetical protein
MRGPVAVNMGVEIMKSALLLSLCLAAAAQSAIANDPPSAPNANAPNAPNMPSQQANNEARAACAPDIQALCAGVQPGGGRILACLKEHKDKVSDGCRKAVVKATQNP